jgi:hypothetical protein
VDRIQLEEALTAVAELLQQSLAGSPEVVSQCPVAVGLPDYSDLVIDTWDTDCVGTLPKLFLGDAVGQRVIADRRAKPLLGGLTLDKDGAAFGAGAFQGVEVPDFSFDGCDMTHDFCLG